MVSPLVVFPDARIATLAVLRAEASTIGDGVTFGTRVPDVANTGGPTLPFVLVSHDATYGRFPVTETAAIRLTVWAASEAATLALAQRARAVLLAYPGGTAVRSFGRLTGPIPTADPDSGTPIAYLTVAARLRPTQL